MSAATVATPSLGRKAAMTRFRIDAVTVLTLIIVLLFAVPSGITVPLLGAVGTPAVLVGLAAIFWWLTSRIVPDLGVQTGRQPVRIALYIFAGAVLASFAAAYTRILPDAEIRGAERGLILVASWSGMAMIATDGIISRARLDVLLRRLVVGAALLATIGILQFTVHLDINALYGQIPGIAPDTEISFIGQRSSFSRVEGTAAHPIEFAVALAAILPLALHYAFNSGGRRLFLRWLAVGLIGAGIMMSVSRSGLLGVAVAGLILAWGWSWRRRIQALLAAGVFLLIVYVAIPHMLGTLRDLVLAGGSDTSITARTDRYSAAADLIAQAPLFGRGFRTFLAGSYFVPDNQYLATLIEMGVVGLVVVLLLILIPLFTAWAARRRLFDAVSRELAQALAASMAVLLVTFVAFDALAYQMLTGISFIIVGCVGALWRLSQARREAPA